MKEWSSWWYKRCNNVFTHQNQWRKGGRESLIWKPVLPDVFPGPFIFLEYSEAEAKVKEETASDKTVQFVVGRIS